VVAQGTAPGQFFIDHNHPFGMACASSNSGMIANAVVDIWKVEAVFPISKYEDDLKVFHLPLCTGTFCDGDFLYDYDRAEML